MSFSPVCVCGHVIEEHSEGLWRECKIPKCGCADFVGDDEEEEDEPQTLGDA